MKTFVISVLFTVLAGTALAEDTVLGSIKDWKLTANYADGDGSFRYCAGERDVSGKPYMKILLGVGVTVLGVGHSAKIPVPSKDLPVKLGFDKGSSFDLKGTVSSPGLVIIPFEFNEEFVGSLLRSNKMSVRAKGVSDEFVLDGGPGVFLAALECLERHVKAEAATQ